LVDIKRGLFVIIVLYPEQNSESVGGKIQIMNKIKRNAITKYTLKPVIVCTISLSMLACTYLDTKEPEKPEVLEEKTHPLVEEPERYDVSEPEAKTLPPRLDASQPETGEPQAQTLPVPEKKAEPELELTQKPSSESMPENQKLPEPDLEDQNSLVHEKTARTEEAKTESEKPETEERTSSSENVDDYSLPIDPPEEHPPSEAEGASDSFEQSESQQSEEAEKSEESKASSSSKASQKEKGKQQSAGGSEAQTEKADAGANAPEQEPHPKNGVPNEQVEPHGGSGNTDEHDEANPAAGDMTEDDKQSGNALIEHQDWPGKSGHGDDAYTSVGTKSSVKWNMQRPVNDK
jgi:hypothetical protein